MRRLFQRIVFFVMFIFVCTLLFAESRGERLFRENKMLEAIPALEEEIQSELISADTYNYLGIAYFKSGDYDKSIDAFERGLKSPVSDAGQLHFNEGNVAFVKGDYALAELCFSLALEAEPQMYSALLNRANARLMLEKYDLSLKDYTDFIAACPDDPQTEKITAMILHIEEQISFEAEERRLLAEEYAAFEAENRRVEEESAREAAEKTLEEEKKRLAEEEMQRRILEDMSNSLQTDTVDDNGAAESEADYEQVNEVELDEVQDGDAGAKDGRSDDNMEVELNDEQVRELELKNEAVEKDDLHYEQVQEGELTAEGDEAADTPELDYEQVMEAELNDESSVETAVNDENDAESELNYEKVMDDE